MMGAWSGDPFQVRVSKLTPEQVAWEGHLKSAVAALKQLGYDAEYVQSFCTPGEQPGHIDIGAPT